MNLSEEERQVLFETNLSKLEETTNELLDEVFSDYPHGLAYGLESQVSRIRMHHKKAFDFYGGTSMTDIFRYKRETQAEKIKKEKLEEEQSRGNLKDYKEKLDENKMLWEKCHAYLLKGEGTNKFLELERKIKVIELTLGYIEQLADIVGSLKNLEEFMSEISSNDN